MKVIAFKQEKCTWRAQLAFEGVEYVVVYRCSLFKGHEGPHVSKDHGDENRAPSRPDFRFGA